MDGKGACRENDFVERLGWTLEGEEVQLRACASVSQARAGIGGHPTVHDTCRSQSWLDGRTPDQAYFNQPMPKTVAA